jgi:alanine transaminase
VTSLLEYPFLTSQDCPQEALFKLFPSDAVQRAKQIMKTLGSPSIGAYSHSQGILSIRENVAAFIEGSN